MDDIHHTGSSRSRREFSPARSAGAGSRCGSASAWYPAQEIPPTAACVAIAADVGYAVVEVVGAIDILSRHELAEALTDADHSGATAVIVDLSAVTVLSAAGYHCFEEVADPLATRGGRLHIVCLPGSPPARILQLFDHDARWPRHADVATAIATVTGDAP